MNGKTNGFLERLSWKAIFASVITFLTVFFAFPEYVLTVRPKIVKVIGASSLSFIEGAITGAILTLLVLKFLTERQRTQRRQVRRKSLPRTSR